MGTLPPLDELSRFALLHGTDKYDHRYTPRYDRLLSTRRLGVTSVLELGVGGGADPHRGGASLRMWQDYFPNARIFGVDFYAKMIEESAGITTIQADQASPGEVFEAVSPFGPFDLIVDDGSHVSAHVIGCFLSLFPLVRDGGFYAIEDLQTSYWPSYGGNASDRGDVTTSIGFLKTLVDGLNHAEIPRPKMSESAYEQEISSLYFWHNLAILERGANTKPSRFVTHVPADYERLDRLAHNSRVAAPARS